MLVQQVALVSELESISASELTRVGAALQKQAIRDFAPIWEMRATVDPFVRLEDVPLGYWPIIVREDIGFDALGVHLDKDGQPFSLVQHTDQWSLTASHELLEMLADPFGNRLVAGTSPKKGQGRVEFLVEICDPCEAVRYAYTANGITVSDFYTPNYFDPVAAVGVRYSFHGKLTKPHQVLKGGYLSWHVPEDDHWWQHQYFGSKPKFVDLGVFTTEMKENLRATIDSLTKPPATLPKAAKARAKSLEAIARPSDPRPSSEAKAKAWRQEIERIKATRASAAAGVSRPRVGRQRGGGR